MNMEFTGRSVKKCLKELKKKNTQKHKLWLQETRFIVLNSQFILALCIVTLALLTFLQHAKDQQQHKKEYFTDWLFVTLPPGAIKQLQYVDDSLQSCM